MLLPFALAAMLSATVMPASPAHAAAKKSVAAGTSAKKGHAYHQFTGVVTSFDKASLTVEKTGKAPKTMVFSRHTEMKTSGELEKDARVTVYYREEGGKPVAHKVVVKAGSLATR
ncbi:MAG: hypothetical protein ABIU54_12965 [Candidatus Eisenbacteria bacterium]